MYVSVVPNRNSPPAILIRESFREDGKVRNRTIANISHWPPQQVQALRAVLKGETVSSGSPDSLRITRSLPHGHVAAVLGSMRNLQLDTILDSEDSRQRDLVLAMIAARIVDPCSKLATARTLDPDTLSSSLGEQLKLEHVSEDDLYRAMDWLVGRQDSIEVALAQRHLAEGGLVLYDISSTYFEGRHCPLAKRGHSRDDKSGMAQIVFGLLTNAEGCPVAVEVVEGNTGDPKTVPAQIEKLRTRFGLQQVVLVGDRGMITSARLREDFAKAEGLRWITALRSPSIRKLISDGAVQSSLFDQLDMAEITHPDYPGERLVVCFNPVLSEERARKRTELLAATDKELEKIHAATQRAKRPLRGKAAIGLRVGRLLGRFKMAKHYKIRIEDDGFHYERKLDNIEREKTLDGLYVVRTNVAAQQMPGSDVVRHYKELSTVERAFRSLKTVDLNIRPIHHRLADRVRAHVLLCMLAYYAEWHMRRRLAPILFDDHDKASAEAERVSIVKPALRSQTALRKARTKLTDEGTKVHSFRTLLTDLATLTLNHIQYLPGAPAIIKLADATPVQKRALELLDVRIATPKSGR